MAEDEILDVAEHTKTVALTTHRRNGTPVTTPVNVATEDGHAYFRTWETSGKAKRLRNNPEVEFAPTNFSGRNVTGPELHARARLLDQKESERARRALRRGFPFLHGVVVPLQHKLRRLKTVHYELEPSGGR